VKKEKHNCKSNIFPSLCYCSLCLLCNFGSLCVARWSCSKVAYTAVTIFSINVRQEEKVEQLTMR